MIEPIALLERVLKIHAAAKWPEDSWEDLIESDEFLAARDWFNKWGDQELEPNPIAGPCLLEACRELVDMLEGLMPASYFQSDSRVCAARNAIAKATQDPGESP